LEKRIYKNLSGIDINTQIILDKDCITNIQNNNIKYIESEECKKINNYINNKNYNKIFDYSSVLNLIKYIYDKFDIIFKNFKINEVTCYYEMVSESIYIYIVFHI